MRINPFNKSKVEPVSSLPEKPEKNECSLFPSNDTANREIHHNYIKKNLQYSDIEHRQLDIQRDIQSLRQDLKVYAIFFSVFFVVSSPWLTCFLHL